MTEQLHHHHQLRADGSGDHQVTPMELFFDLVYVFAITQLSHLLLEHLDAHGAAQTGLLLLAVWTAWIYTAWFTNWFDPDDRTVRTVLIGVMVCSLIMSATLPDAFGDRGLIFATAYTVMQVGRTAYTVYGLSGRPAAQRNFQRILCWIVVSSIFWIAGGLADGAERELLWLVGRRCHAPGTIRRIRHSGFGALDNARLGHLRASHGGALPAFPDHRSW
jgi:low temperature requirement protein LtrA